MEVKNTLNHQNPELLIYENSILKIEVLGGIKIQGMDRMRATLKITDRESERPAVRHNIDLYNDTQLEKFIRKIAEKLEISTQIISATLSELTEALETYRLEEIKKEQDPTTQQKQITISEREKALEILQSKNLLEYTKQQLQKTGIQGEETNALILWLAMTSRKMKDPLSVICLAKSGQGKSYLMEKVADCIPESEKKEHTQFTGNSFYYYKKEEIKGKVFLIEDLDGAEQVMFPIRELQTKKRISKTVTTKDKNGRLRTVTLIVEGPLSVIGCTTREKIYEDNANRSILICLDGSKAQDQRIMTYQKKLRAGIVDKHQEYQAQDQLQNLQLQLQKVKVINPYAPKINLPKEIFKPRRTLPLLLNFIETITFYHQHQRVEKVNKETGEICIETQIEDIENAFEILKEVLFKKADELSGATRKFYEELKEWNKTFKPRKKEKRTIGFYGSDVRKSIRIHPRTLNRYLNELAEYGLIRATGGNKNTTGYSYQIEKSKDYKTLQESIEKQIEKVLQSLKVKSSRTVRQ